MKKVKIFAGYKYVPESKDRFHMVSTFSHRNYVVKDYYQNETPPYGVTFQMSIIAPYDDADYIWAKCTSTQIKFIDNRGNIVDKMTVPSYEPDDYENFDEYCSAILEDTMYTLDDLNADIEPRILHD